LKEKPTLRSLPRLFIPGATDDGPIDIPPTELDKLRKVLRLSSGAMIGILPNDGSVITAMVDGKQAVPVDRTNPQTEPKTKLTIAQALPKGDKLDEIVRACSEIGVSHFVVFPSDRTVVKWDEKKTADRLSRLATIARESCELSFRTVLPTFESQRNLADVLKRYPEAVVLSEIEGIAPKLTRDGKDAVLVVGPEGGWSGKELAAIGSRGITLGPRVLRVDHAAAAAAAILLLESA
jgi:16S rRNA (uracil1498-N3)-methyltransferase